MSFVAPQPAFGAATRCCQTVPLPPGLRAVLSPGSDAALRRILAGLPAPSEPQSAWLPLSVDVRPRYTVH